MPAKRNQYGMSTTDEKFIEIWNRLGSPSLVATELHIAPQAVHKRRRKIEQRCGIELLTSIDSRTQQQKQYRVSEKVRGRLAVDNGNILIGSDAHYWPDLVSTAHRGFVKLVRQFKPVAVIQNGDVLDAATISRWPRISWENRPTVRQELEVVQDRLEEIEKASLNSRFFWTFGNHDGRFELNLAKLAPEYEGVAGFSLKDHFPRWTPCMSVMINESCMVKHRWHSGIHAVYNNTLRSGLSIVTGHLHSMKVTPWSDYTGDRYGVDSGTLADPWGPQFEAYMEDNPRSWRAGFVVLTFKDGQLMPPELVQVIGENKIWFRGNVIEV